MEKQKRKEAKLQYKQTHRPMGVYQIKNQANGKILIGSSLNLEGIKNRHWFGLNMGMHYNKTLQQEWKEYGEENFTFEVLEYIKPEEETVENFTVLEKYRDLLKNREEAWINRLQPCGNKGYL
ncbi:GIY-YIG nuclease family protein [Aneurinibacillus danicus]|uniref:Nuclease n=2 Tax=Aneurinibacillus TaxID=55079 RepID=A0A511VC17_9BACL|nr:GIY-YIG nuclease family protein [Aneurinibacillus danicus]GEN34782.1 nuclease [Aneurinibacillus danicus]